MYLWSIAAPSYKSSLPSPNTKENTANILCWCHVTSHTKTGNAKLTFSKALTLYTISESYIKTPTLFHLRSSVIMLLTGTQKVRKWSNLQYDYVHTQFHKDRSTGSECIKFSMEDQSRQFEQSPTVRRQQTQTNRPWVLLSLLVAMTASILTRFKRC
jgi:hypothetical protein